MTPVTVSAGLRDEAAGEMQAKYPADWTADEVDKYLGYSLWSYFSACEIYKEVMGYLPQDPQWLVDVGYLSSWPLNPFDGWRPVRLLTVEDGFSPGDIVVQPCPDDPMAYELGIYGADPGTELVRWCRPWPGHEDWLVPTPGIRYLTGAPALTLREVQSGRR